MRGRGAGVLILPAAPAAIGDRCRAETLLRWMGAGLDVVEPGAAVRRNLQIGDGEIRVGSQRVPFRGAAHLIAVGKAAPAMAGSAMELLAGCLGHVLIVSSHEAVVPVPARLIVAGHPLPDERSVQAGRAALDLARGAGPEDVVVFLVSGGGSALLEAPAAGLQLADIRMVTAELLVCGASIDETNVVRTHLSAVKGGRLAQAVPASYVTLALSDVVGSPPEHIASGPTVAPSTTPQDALEILDRHRVRGTPGVRSHLRDAAPAAPGRSAPYVVVADGAAAAEAIRAAASAAGVEAAVHVLEGDVRRAARDAHACTRPGTLGIFAGETTVHVRGAGRGGRNQEAALVLVGALSGTTDIVVTLGTDGIDGPTDAAGAMVDGSVLARGRAAGFDLAQVLEDNDSHRYLDATGNLVRTGPTGTNVGDIWLIDRTVG